MKTYLVKQRITSKKYNRDFAPGETIELEPGDATDKLVRLGVIEPAASVSKPDQVGPVATPARTRKPQSQE